MKRTIDLEHHFCITTANQITKIARPLFDAFGVTHFRYLKLFPDGSRILLSNHPDCVRFFYGEGHYKQMWFDGEFPHFLNDGWQVWDAMRAIAENSEITPLEKDINHALNLYHGMTFISAGNGFHEIYTFDSNRPAIYQLNKNFFLRFISYFKEQANDLIQVSDKERLIVSTDVMKRAKNHAQNCTVEEVNSFLEQTKVNRYYLTGKYNHIYLTEKELRCVYWLIQGKSAEEIASIEGNTKKTIQYHFENIRSKLGCYKQTQIIPIILGSGILNALK